MQGNHSENCKCEDLTFEQAWKIASDIVSAFLKNETIIPVLWDYFSGMITFPLVGYNAIQHRKAIDYVYERYSQGDMNGDYNYWEETYFAMIELDSQRERLKKYAKGEAEIEFFEVLLDLAGYVRNIANVATTFKIGFDIGTVSAELLAAACMCKDCGAPDNSKGGLSGQCAVVISPIILNLDGDSSNDTVALKDSNAYFDMKDWGTANKTGWVSPTDGLLVYDKNNNGQIDNITELFGDQNYKNGFEQLRVEADGNKDGKIDSSDGLFNALQVWIDGNGDGVVQNGELHSLSELGISSINLNHTVGNGNSGGEAIASGTYTRGDGSVGEATDYLFDVSMTDNTLSGDYEITEAIAAIFPNLNGYGSFKDLHIAMSLDESLYEFIKDNMTDLDSMSVNFNTFMMKWSGLEEKHESLGINTNGELRFIDMIWILANMSGSTIVKDMELISGNPEQCYKIQENTAIYNDIKTRFLSIMNIVINFNGVEYRESYDRVVITDVFAFFNSVLSKPLGDEAVIRMLMNSQHFSNFISSGVKEALGLLQPLYAAPKDNYVPGTLQIDTLNGNNLDNVIVGGKGNDNLYGGNGNDTYIFNRGDGSDIITDTAGLDCIVFGSDEGVGFLVNNGKLNISYGSGDSIVVSSGNIERYERADGSYLTDADVNYIIFAYCQRRLPSISHNFYTQSIRSC
jgi:hypothetical protein